jgi:hypothetical protein
MDVVMNQVFSPTSMPVLGFYASCDVTFDISTVLLSLFLRE